MILLSWVIVLVPGVVIIAWTRRARVVHNCRGPQQDGRGQAVQLEQAAPGDDGVEAIDAGGTVTSPRRA
jgi:hypothetical protein